jgi:hypothetical protein
MSLLLGEYEILFDIVVARGVQQLAMNWLFVSDELSIHAALPPSAPAELY